MRYHKSAENTVFTKSDLLSFSYVKEASAFGSGRPV